MFERKSYYFLTQKSEPKQAGPGDLRNMSVKIWPSASRAICFQIEELGFLGGKKVVIWHHNVTWILDWNKTKRSKYALKNDYDTRVVKVDDSIGQYLEKMLNAFYREEIRGSICEEFIKIIFHLLEIENAPEEEESPFEIHLPHYFRYYSKKIEQTKLRTVKKVMSS